MSGKVSEVTKKASENSNMSSAEFAQHAMQFYLAPPSLGSVKLRLRHAAYMLGRRNWTANRVRDIWYRDLRASAPKWEEIHDLEELTGLRYAREELNEIDALIANADRLLNSNDPDFHRPFLAALRALLGAPDRSGAEE
jgi:hypothetical protein